MTAASVKLLRNPRFLRIAGPIVIALAVGAGLWHSAHAYSAWSQTQEFKTSDPPLSAYFWSAFQVELGTAMASLFAGFFAWQIARRKRHPND